MDFAKPVVNSEITASVTAIEQSVEQQASPSVIAPVDTHVVQSEECLAATPIDNSNKYVSSFDYALENVYDQIVQTIGVASTAILEPVLHVQQDNVEPPLAQQHEEVFPQGDSARLEGAATFNATATLPEQHPFATLIPHHCPLITKDLETIQQAVVVTIVDDEEGFTKVVSKSSRKKKKCYQTRSRGPLSTSSQ